MRKIIYAFGIATFLAMFVFTIATSLTNPFYGMSEAALAQTSTNYDCGGSSNTGNPVTWNSRGDSHGTECIVRFCTRTYQATFYKFEIEGGFTWQQYFPGMDISAAVSSETRTVTEEITINGNKSTCDKTNNDNCVVVECH